MKYSKISKIIQNGTIEYFNFSLNYKTLIIRTIFNNCNIDRCNAGNGTHD